MDRSFGPGDLGAAGIVAFWKTHRCGPTCRGLGLISSTSCLRHLSSTSSHVTAKGNHVGVHKYTSIGCAVITMPAEWISIMIINRYSNVVIGKTKVQLRLHKDKETTEEGATDIFADWGHQAEKASPLSAQELLKFFEIKPDEVVKEHEVRPALGSTSSDAFDELVCALDSARHTGQIGQHSCDPIVSPLRGPGGSQPTSTPDLVQHVSILRFGQEDTMLPVQGALSRHTAPFGGASREHPSPRAIPAQNSGGARSQENQRHFEQPQPARQPAMPNPFPIQPGPMLRLEEQPRQQVMPTRLPNLDHPGQFVPAFSTREGANQQLGTFNQVGFSMGPIPSVPQLNRLLHSSEPQMMMFRQQLHATLLGCNAPVQYQPLPSPPLVLGQSATDLHRSDSSAAASDNSGQEAAVLTAGGGNDFISGPGASLTDVRVASASHAQGHTIVRGPNGKKLVVATDERALRLNSLRRSKMSLASQRNSSICCRSCRKARRILKVRFCISCCSAR